MWAAAVPANYDRKLGALVEDIYGDHQLMVRPLHMLKGLTNSIWASLPTLLQNIFVICLPTAREIWAPW